MAKRPLNAPGVGLPNVVGNSAGMDASETELMSVASTRALRTAVVLLVLIAFPVLAVREAISRYWSQWWSGTKPAPSSGNPHGDLPQKPGQGDSSADSNSASQSELGGPTALPNPGPPHTLTVQKSSPRTSDQTPLGQAALAKQRQTSRLPLTPAAFRALENDGGGLNPPTWKQRYAEPVSSRLPANFARDNFARDNFARDNFTPAKLGPGQPFAGQVRPDLTPREGPWATARRRLQEAGIEDFRLERWGNGYRFSCRVPLTSGLPGRSRHLAAVGDQPLQAVQQVLDQVRTLGN